MKLFLKRFFYALLVGIVISLVLDITISNALKKLDTFAYGESVIWNEIYNGNINEDLLIYGSSRAWVHFSPKIIQENTGLTAYNLGIDGHNFWLQHLRHKALLKYNQAPKIIVLSVGPFTLNKRENLYNLDQFLPFMYKEDVYAYTSSYDGFTVLDYSIPLLRYIGKREAILTALKDHKKNKKNGISYRVKGYKGMDRSWNQDLEIAKSKMDHIEITKHKDSELLLDDFLTECKTEEIKVILVYSPTYIEGQRFIKNREEIIDTYHGLAIKHEIPFLDYSNNSMCYDKDLFYNSIHLNIKGSELFTKMFVDDLKEQNLID